MSWDSKGQNNAFPNYCLWLFILTLLFSLLLFQAAECSLFGVVFFFVVVWIYFFFNLIEFHQNTKLTKIWAKPVQLCKYGSKMYSLCTSQTSTAGASRAPFGPLMWLTAQGSPESTIQAPLENISQNLTWLHIFLNDTEISGLESSTLLSNLIGKFFLKKTRLWHLY